jgi:hypothetical protein
MAKRLETSVTARDEYRPGRGKQHASCQTNQRNSCSKPRNAQRRPHVIASACSASALRRSYVR